MSQRRMLFEAIKGDSLRITIVAMQKHDNELSFSWGYVYPPSWLELPFKRVIQCGSLNVVVYYELRHAGTELVEIAIKRLIEIVNFYLDTYDSEGEI